MPAECRAASPAQLLEQAPWPVPDTIRGGQLSPRATLWDRAEGDNALTLAQG